MSIRTYPQFPQQAYLATNSTQGSLTLTGGRKAITSSGGGMYISGSTVQRIVPLQGARGVALQFFGTDANDETITAAAIWAVTFSNYSGATSPGGLHDATVCDINLYGTTGTLTLSTATGTSTSDLVPSTSFIADTIASWTLGTYGTMVEAAYGLGTADEYSPTGNIPGCLIIPNFGPSVHGFIVEFDLGTAASANALYTLTP